MGWQTSSAFYEELLAHNQLHIEEHSFIPGDYNGRCIFNCCFMTGKATVVQGFPLPRFSGENVQSEDDGFERWIESFEDRADLAGWSKDQRLYQLKVHLERTALQVFRMMPEQDRKEYETAVQRLKERFRPIDIAELKGIGFHQRMQLPEESVEQLGIALQNLVRKASPQAKGREYDRLLKGWFFQALHTKWQRKLGAPKTDESFSELYGRARILERHDQQYNAMAAARVEVKPPLPNEHLARQRPRRDYRPITPKQGGGRDSKVPQQFPNPSPITVPGNRSRSDQCYRCGGIGHFARTCSHTPPGPQGTGAARAS